MLVCKHVRKAERCANFLYGFNTNIINTHIYIEHCIPIKTKPNGLTFHLDSNWWSIRVFQFEDSINVIIHFIKQNKKLSKQNRNASANVFKLLLDFKNSRWPQPWFGTFVFTFEVVFVHLPLTVHMFVSRLIQKAISQTSTLQIATRDSLSSIRHHLQALSESLTYSIIEFHQLL